MFTKDLLMKERIFHVQTKTIKKIIIDFIKIKCIFNVYSVVGLLRLTEGTN